MYFANKAQTNETYFWKLTPQTGYNHEKQPRHALQQTNN
jgi:hypothetical protein